MRFVMLAVFVLALTMDVLTAASGSAPAKEEAPAKPITLDERDPDFHELKKSTYKPNATYRIRKFEQGSVESLEGMMKSLKLRSQANLDKLDELSRIAEQKKHTEASTRILELKNAQTGFQNTLTEYADGVYQSNISLEKLRADIHALETDVQNLTALLDAQTKENQVSWE